jgi:hypothetical protein
LAFVAVGLVGGAAFVGYEAYMRSSAGVFPIEEASEDLSRPRVLAGYADHIFIGVVEDSGTFVERDAGPERTVFTVRVLQNMKGNLPDVTLVNQLGGTDRYGNTWYIPGAPLIGPGHTYLFATRTATEDRLGETATPRWGHLLADDPGDRQELVEVFERAIQDAIPYPIPNPAARR